MDGMIQQASSDGAGLQIYMNFACINFYILSVKQKKNEKVSS